MIFDTKVIAAEGEHKASRALRHAAEVIADSPAALQVCFIVTDRDTQTHTNRHKTQEVIADSY